MTKKRNWIILLSVAAVLLLAVLAVGIWTNLALVLTEYTIQNPEIPASFDGFRIAQISDLHNAEFGENNEKLIAMLRAAQPDIIAITGDLIDSRNTNISVALDFADRAMEIAPCYYVTGNHEKRILNYDTLKDGLLARGVVVLEEDKVTIERAGEELLLIGVHDASFRPNYFFETHANAMHQTLQPLVQEGCYTILLSHRPELLEVYSEYAIDLALTGHSHGGQIRLPLLGGIFAPDQGFFPKYDAGLYRAGNTQMIVSRGLGNSLVPLRINNRPEVVLITLTQ